MKYAENSAMSARAKMAWKLGCGAAAILSLIAALSLWAAGHKFYEAFYMAPPDSRRVTRTPTEALGPRTLRVICPTSDGTYAPGWYREGTTGAAIVLLHGLGGTRQQLVSIARRFLDEGWGVLLIDQRGHGEHPSALTTLGRAEALDALAAVEWLRQREEVDPERIGMYGASMGATTCIYAAARDPELACAVADSSYAVFRDQVSFELERERAPIRVAPAWRPFIVSTFLMFSRRIIGKWSREPDPVDVVRRIRCPLFLIHGEQDKRIDPDNLDQLTWAARAGEVNVTSWKVRDAGHCTYHDSEEFSQRLLGFFRTHL